ncbi:MAG: MBL fold metallo-hydrolase [Lachnospiraceae bacterium]|nr:MBL fold metallo-hydrolase [Lachnospiraceae bacterium]
MLLVNVVGVVLAILAMGVVIYVFPMCAMQPLNSGEVEGTDVIAIKNRINNLFFIPSGEDWIVIDAGSDAKLVKQEMELMSIDGRRVKSVFLTHTDYDHVASVVLFPYATIYMSKWEEQMINGSTRRQFLKKNSLPDLSSSNKVVYMSDNEVIDLREHRVRIICTPGHTRGSAIYAVDEKYLFTGDAFKVTGRNILVHPYTMDRVQAKETIGGIKDELKKYEKVFTAHYGLIQNDIK